VIEMLAKPASYIRRALLSASWISFAVSATGPMARPTVSLATVYGIKIPCQSFHVLPNYQDPRLMRYNGQRTVVVAMVAMRMMQPTVDQVIDVVTVWYSLMSATGAVLMT
jgi:hypothetical protein